MILSQGLKPGYLKKKYQSERDGQLPEKEAKYCRCILHVASQQKPECLRQKSWFKQIDGGRCTNPYAVCAKSVGKTSRRCGLYYNYDELPDEELIGYAHLNRIEVPDPYNRGEILKRIFDWKKNE